MINPNDKIEQKIAMQLISNISKSTASRYIQHARASLKKEKHQILQVYEFCAYYGIDLNNCNLHQ